MRGGVIRGPLKKKRELNECDYDIFEKSAWVGEFGKCFVLPLLCNLRQHNEDFYYLIA